MTPDLGSFLVEQVKLIRDKIKVAKADGTYHKNQDAISVALGVPDGEYPFVISSKLVVRGGRVVNIVVDDDVVAMHHLHSPAPGKFSLCTLSVKDAGKYPHWPEPEPDESVWEYT